MKRLKKYSIALATCLTTLLAGSCVEEFNALLPDSEINLLVVDGNIISDSTVVFTLSKSFSLNEETLPDDYNQVKAEVSVVGSDGTTYKGVSEGKGKYSVKIGTLNPQHTYHLEIQCDGDTYTSTPQLPLVTEDMELSFSQPEEYGNVHVEVTTPASADKEIAYYIWDYTEDWEIRTEYRCQAVYESEAGAIVEYDYYPYAQGWIHKEPYEILVNSTENYQGNHFNKKAIYLIGSTDNRLCYLYSTFIVQRKISKGEYEYYQCKEKYTNDMGGLFTPQPSELPTNITCTNDNKRVIGYVGVNMNVSKGRLYIPNSEVQYDKGFTCRTYEFEDAEPGAIYSRGYQVAYYQAMFMSPTIVRWTTRQCVDCRVFGADPNGKPDFWPESDL